MRCGGSPYTGFAKRRARESEVGQSRWVNLTPCWIAVLDFRFSRGSTHAIVLVSLSEPVGVGKITSRSMKGSNATGRRSKSPPRLKFPTRHGRDGPGGCVT